MWFQIDKPGIYVFCTEYCGDGHSKMVASVEAKNIGLLCFLNEKDFDEDMPNQTKLENNCIQKKDVMRVIPLMVLIVGPTWKGLYGANREFTDGTSAISDEEYLKESILYPQRKIVKGYQPVMPSYQGLLVDVEINAIIEYIKELINNELH